MPPPKNNPESPLMRVRLEERPTKNLPCQGSLQRSEASSTFGVNSVASMSSQALPTNFAESLMSSSKINNHFLAT